MKYQLWSSVLNMNREEKERKQSLLEEMIRNRQSPAGHESHLEILLRNYASGSNHREEIATNIVAEFRPFLRIDNGPNYDGPLYARIIDALQAAEQYGRMDMIKKSEIIRPDGTTIRGIDRLFSANEVQRCLFCGTEYRPRVERHDCHS